MRQEYRVWIRWLAVLLAGALILVACVEAPLILSPAQKDLPSQTAALETGSFLSLDGQPLVTGQTLTLTETDPVEWWEQIIKPGDPTVQERLLGKGSSWEYQAPNEAAMVTVLARSESSEKKVSFTVSPPDVIVAPHVKVLSDQVIVNGKGNGSIRIKKDPSLPSLRVGDVVIGARGEVDPSKVKSIQIGSEEIELVVDPALPKEVIEKGTATFEQTIDWSGSSGEVMLVDIPGKPFHIADDLDPKWEGFVQAGDPVQTGLEVNVNSGISWQPTYSGKIVFDPLSPSGISTFDISQQSRISTSITISTSGSDTWIQNSKTYNIFPVKVNTIQIQVGPIKIPLILERSGYVKLSAYAIFNNPSMTSLDFKNGTIRENFHYDFQDSQPWMSQISFDIGSKIGSIDPFGLEGFLFIGNHSDIKFSIPGEDLIKVGINFEGVRFGQVDKSDIKSSSTINNTILEASIQKNVESRLLGLVNYFIEPIKNNSVENSTNFSSDPKVSCDLALSSLELCLVICRETLSGTLKDCNDLCFLTVERPL